jgi:hypothetical protein
MLDFVVHHYESIRIAVVKRSMAHERRLHVAIEERKQTDYVSNDYSSNLTCCNRLQFQRDK